MRDFQTANATPKVRCPKYVTRTPVSACAKKATVAHAATSAPSVTLDIPTASLATVTKTDLRISDATTVANALANGTLLAKRVTSVLLAFTIIPTA